MNSTFDSDISPYMSFTSEQWGKLRANTPLSLDEDDVERLRGINVALSLDDVRQIYLPLSRLLNLYVRAAQELYRASDTFLGHLPAKVPFVIGLAGSVAVGKSTTARVLQALLGRWPNHPAVDLITTDGFLYPNSVLEERGLMERKGFPESFDRRKLLEFLNQIKSGAPEVKAPLYSHLIYDIEPDRFVTVNQPDIVIVEGLNVLQTGAPQEEMPLFVSDFFDFSIYVDAPPDLIERWFVERFFTLRDTSFSDPDSYFKRFAKLNDSDAEFTATSIWRSINMPNLVQNIAPTRARADLIIEKGQDHLVSDVHLRRL